MLFITDGRHKQAVRKDVPLNEARLLLARTKHNVRNNAHVRVQRNHQTNEIKFV